MRKVLGSELAAMNSMRVLHITDTHLFEVPGQRLLGVDTDATLKAVLVHAARAPKPDLILATGDIAQQASEATYDRFIALVADHFPGVPMRWLAGNHDAIMPMTRMGSRHGPSAEIALGNWHFALLDSHVEGMVPGHLGEADLAALDETLASAPGQFSLIGVHHHPLPVGADWLDTQLIDNADALFELCDKHPRIRCIIFGHVHQAVEAVRRSRGGPDVPILGTPSTCFQFLPHSQDYGLDENAAPGYRWLDLAADGSVSSHIVRVEEAAASPDMAASGY